MQFFFFCKFTVIWQNTSVNFAARIYFFLLTVYIDTSNVEKKIVWKHFNRERTLMQINVGVTLHNYTLYNYTLRHCFSVIHVLFKVTIIVECVSIVLITTSALRHFLSLTPLAFFSTHFWTLLILSWKRERSYFPSFCELKCPWISVHL